MAKPSDIYLGVIDLFAVVLPGAALCSFSLKADYSRFLWEIFEVPDSPAANWLAFAFVAYALGHLVFILGASLDGIYDLYRKFRWPDRSGNAFRVADELRKQEHDAERLGVDGTRAMNTYSWAKAKLLLQAPASAAQVARYEADSKFFRSLIVILLFLAITLALKNQVVPSFLCSAMTVAAFLGYADRRYKSTQWAYRYVVTLCATASRETKQP